MNKNTQSHLFAEVRQNLREISESQKRSQKNTEQYRKESEQIRKESEQIRKESEQYRKESEQIRKESEQIRKELKLQMKETDKKLKQFIGETGNRWGALGENLVEGNLAKRLKEKGIAVDSVLTQVKTPRTRFDIIVVNGTEAVIVEVKCTLDPSDVDEFAEKLRNIRQTFPLLKEKVIYGAMAFLMGANRSADRIAEKQGFFVIKATGDVLITNKQNFKPKIFH